MGAEAGSSNCAPARPARRLNRVLGRRAEARLYQASDRPAGYQVIRRLMRKTLAQRRNPATPPHLGMRRWEARRNWGSGSGAPRERWNQAPSRPTKPMRAVAAPNIKPAMMRTKLKLNNGPPPQCLA